MRTYTSRAQLKAYAREQLSGHYLSMSSAFITLFLLRYVISVPTAVSAIPGIAGIITFYGADLLITIFFSLFQAGISYMFLSNACGVPVSSGHIFAGFSFGITKVISIWVIPSLLTLLPIVIPDLMLSWILEKKGTELLTWMAVWLLVVLPLSWFAQTLVKLPFSMVYYLLADFPELENRECLRRSIQLMRGHKLRYLKMLLSFLPLYFLGLLSFGIGLIYVLPYREQTIANFYLDLISQSADAE